MSAFGNFSGFGQNNGQNGGGFGSTNNNNNTPSSGFGSGFGGATPTTTTTTTTNPFGAARPSTGFGSGGGFGQNSGGTSLFGHSKPAFGAASSSGSGLFGGTATAGPGGFGGNSGAFAANSTNNTSTNPFGGSTSGGSFSFGQSKTPFGGGSGTGLFGSTGGTGANTGFGNSQAMPFGQAGSGSALGPAVPPSEGTALTPYTVTNEKEPNGNNTSNFQSINVMPAYGKYSLEELRQADYDKGRRYGNVSGQSGGFGSASFGGTSNTFGGGATNTNAFGGAGGGTGFGSANTNTAFGSSGGGTSGLFGGNISQGPGLFGGQSGSTPSGGLFGTAGAGSSFGGGGIGTGAFGGAGASNTFGTNPAQTQNKPGLFDSTPSAGNTGGGLFGGGGSGQTGLTGFGNNQPTQNPNTFGGLGTQPQQGQDQNKAGGIFGSGGFGTSQSSQVQPSGGLFGTTQPARVGGGLFGGAGGGTAGQALGGFGSTAPANGTSGITGGGLFGSSNTQQQQPQPNLWGGASGGFGTSQNPSTGGLFVGVSGTNPQQPGTGLFGQGGGSTGGSWGAHQQLHKPGLFDSKPGLFDSNPQYTSTQGGGLFGGQPSNSLLNNSQQNQQTPQQGQGLHSSLLDGNPFGQSSIWSGLPEATSQNSGPLVTPLSASQRLREGQMKATPSSRLSSATLMTPPHRQGYGLSYSTYGSPNSAASTPSGGNLGTGSVYGRGFTGGSFGRSMAKSFSASNLRQQFAADGESVLSPGAFAPGSSRYSSGSIRRLTIDRNLKTDLFNLPGQSLPALPSSSDDTNGARGGVDNGEPSNSSNTNEQPNKLKKRVSFDKDTTGGIRDNMANGSHGALIRSDGDNAEPTAEDQGYLRSSRRARPVNGAASAPPSTEQVRGNELAVVPEDHESENMVSKKRQPADAPAAADSQPGEYWMKPPRGELSSMSREQLQHFRGLQVGRKGCGYVTFDQEVDLTAIRPDDLFGKLIEIRIRSITVYPDASTKPPPGKGLNIPSTLRLENSWPRARGRPTSATKGPLFDKHILRLKEMENTHYISYDTRTGVWTFTVDHYTRYGLDFDDDDPNEAADGDHVDGLRDPPNAIASAHPSSSSQTAADLSMDLDDDAANESSMAEDTFEFKKKALPGAYGRPSAPDPDQDLALPAQAESSPEAMSDSGESDQSVELRPDQEMNMVGSYPEPSEIEQASSESHGKPNTKASQRPWDSPSKPLIDLDGDWAEQLRRTISPRKQNRETLREIQGKVLLDRSVNFPCLKPQVGGGKSEIKTNIDLMNSLFGDHEQRMVKSRKQDQGPRIEYPYPKRAKVFDAGADVTGPEQEWHDSFPVKWTPIGSLLFSRTGSAATQGEQAWTWQDTRLIATRGRNVWESRLFAEDEKSYGSSEWDWQNSDIDIADGVPFAKQRPMKFTAFCEQITQRDAQQVPTADSRQELDIYRLAHVLFDNYEDQFSKGLTPSQKDTYADRIRKDRLSEFWARLIQERNPEPFQQPDHIATEEHIVTLLSAHRVHDACRRLSELGSLRLSTMIAQLDNADGQFQHNMAEQLQAWWDQDVVSEMSEPIRALYEILAGNTTISHGREEGPFENRASTFSVSERFDLDWMQAFGLCLWYGEAKNGPIEDVVQDFASKLARDEESAKPWPDGDADGQHYHPLWVILKLYAATKGSKEDGPTLPSQLAPLAQSFDNRITFQLHHALTSNISALPVDKALADKMAVDLAFQLSSSSFLLGAVFALMHLSDASQREWHIRDLLNRHAASLPQMLDGRAGEVHPDCQVLIDRLRIPRPWISAAKAIHYRAQHQFLDELKYLLLAEEWVEAHDCLCRRVAPRAVIDENWHMIKAMIDQFGTQMQKLVPDWPTGGGIYADFVALVDQPEDQTKKANGEKHHKQHSEGEETRQEQDRTARVKRLQSSLAELARSFKQRGAHLTAGGDVDELEQRVACHEMARIVADIVAKEQQGHNKSSNNNSQHHSLLLDLPLTADARLRHARSMAANHYRALMATATAH